MSINEPPAPVMSPSDVWSTPIIRSSVEVPEVAIPAADEVTRSEVQDLLGFLAANVDVARADGKHDKACRFQALLKTAKTLASLAELAGTVS